MPPRKDHYETLGVSKDASPDEIKVCNRVSDVIICRKRTDDWPFSFIPIRIREMKKQPV
jgi:hypothetical protein